MKTAQTTPAFRVFSIIALCALICGLSVLIPSQAFAHDQLVSSTPQDGATLEKQPDWLELEFSGEIQDIGAEVKVQHKGKNVSAGELTIDGRTLMAALPQDLDAGKYTVIWRVVSSDGHPIDGTYSFTIEDSGGAGTSGNSGQSGEAQEPESGTAVTEPTDNQAASSPAPVATTDAAQAADDTGSITPGMWIAIIAGAAAAVVIILVLLRKKAQGLPGTTR